jgi:hypothetical protein
MVNPILRILVRREVILMCNLNFLLKEDTVNNNLLFNKIHYSHNYRTILFNSNLL